MTTLRAHTVPLRSRLVVCFIAGALSLAFAGYDARSAPAFTTASTCALPGSDFQGGDGDEATPSLAEQTYCTEHLLPTTTDWQSLPNVINSPDSQAEDNSFSGGNKETSPGSWVIQNQAGGVTPGKANIVSAWSQTEADAAATFLYMSFEREATTGDTFLTFELNQVKGLWENEQKAKIPCRTTGDVLLAYNVGGSSVNVAFYRWITDTSTLVTIAPDPTPHACAKTGHFEVSGGMAVAPPNEQGALNATEITNYLTDTANSPTPSTFSVGSFGEASLNLTAIFEGAKLGPCFAFGQMWMSSRSSESIDSQLEDYVSPVALQADSCSISGRKFDDASGNGLDEASKPGLGGWTIQLLNSSGTEVLRTTTTASDGTYAFTNVAPGSYLVREVGKSGWTCDYPGTGSSCQHAATLNTSDINSSGNDFGNHPTSTVVTTQEPASGIVGAKFGDSATVSGSTGAPTPSGSVEFRLYSDNHCGTLIAGPIVETLAEGSAAIPTAEKLTLEAGKYWWVASYGGDSYNASGQSACAAEPVEVGQAGPQVETTQDPAAGTVGATFKDKATIAGLFGEHPGGSVSWKLYENSKCEGEPLATDGPVSVTANGTYETPKGASPTASGTYYWVASYSGDHNDAPAASACAAEPVEVGQAGPQVETTQDPAAGTVGATFKDKATIAGLFGEHPGGSVSWKLYENSKCEGEPLATDGPVSVTANGTYETPKGASPTASGTYYWVASYSGDHNDAPAASACAAEPVEVGQAGPQVETTQDPAAGTVGATFKDKATIAGLFGEHPGGSVSWKLYENSKCEGEPLATDGPVSVTANGTYETPKGASPTASGTYYWVASYSGDHNDAPAASACAAEPVEVGQAGPQVETTQDPAAGTVGATFKDKATIAGLFGEHPGGSVSWKLYENSKCEGEPLATDGPVSVTANGTYETPKGASPTASGTYYWVASYSGDHNDAPAASACAAEPVEVGQAGPQVETTQDPAAGTVGATFKDKATIAGLFGEHPGGSVSWKLYENSKCEGEPLATDGPVSVTANGTYETPKGASPTASGTYYWVASYSGDHNDAPAASACAAEPVEVGQAGPQVETTQDPAAGTVGATFKDKATIAGLFGEHPGGSVSWKLYENSKCEGEPLATDGPVSVTANGTYETPKGASPTASGTYYWVASYSGDHNDAPAASACAAEPVEVGQAGPQVETTQDPAAGTVGATFKDKATIAGLFGEHPGGSVSWKLYENSKCEGEPLATDGPVSVTANGTYETPKGASPTASGTYYWVASYSGDHNDAPAASACAAEPVEVGQAGPQVETTQDPAAGTVGATFKDKATIAGLFGEHPGGSVSWKLYENSKCEGEPLATDGPVSVTANGTYETPKGASPTASGTYYWVASYSGDHNDAPAASACAAEPVEVGQAGPQVETTQDPAAGTVGATFKDKATIAGLFGEHPGGSVSWKLYENSKCEGEPLATDGPVSVTANGTYETPKGASPTASGTYYWVASYSGDHNDAPAASACAAEPVEVGQAGPQVETTQDPAAGTVGATFKDKATIAGLFGEHPGGSVSWKLYENSKCEGEPLATDGPVSVTANGTYETPKGASPTASGTYYWVASYSGDHNDAPAASACAAEPVEVGQAGPQVETTQDPAAGTVGATFKDKATIAGLFGEHPGGSVSWKLYENSKCEGEPLATDGPVSVTANGTYETPKGASPTASGTYYWVASYSGDHNDAPAASACAAEPVEVGQAGPQVETTQDPAAGTVGATFKDKATIAGLFGEHPGGSVSWKLYENSKCEGEPLATDGPVSVTANGTYETPKGASPTASGTYYWVASYSGDHNDAPAASACAAEPVEVGQAGPQVETTQDPAAGTVGATFKDKATIAGLFGEHPGGSVSWKLYENSKCEGEPLATDGPVSVTANGTYETPKGASPTASGTYYWVASYSGDHNDAPAASACAAEPVEVGQAGPQVETTQDPAAGTVGATFKDKATIAGLFGEHPGGSVSWKLYENSKCEGEPLATDGPVSVTANGTYETPKGASPTASGTYYWVASYSGDHNDAPAASACAAEPVEVGQAGPQVETTQDPAAGTVGATFKDKATIAGLFGEHPGGSVSWKLYENSKCEGEPLATDGPVSVTANGTYETPKGASPTASGTYYWVASYSGDHNDAPAASACAAEPISITPTPVPAVVVLPEKVISGEAQPHGPAACIAPTTTTVYVTGREVVSATFYLDGRKVKTVLKPDNEGRYSTKISARKLKYGAHRVKVIVVFEAKSQTATKTFKILVFRCRPPRPQFTG